jgi:tetratricopeptide (TPR) repeat protein
VSGALRRRLGASAVAALLALSSFAAGAPKEAPSYVQPAENLLIIVADLQRHINDDVYKFPYPTDVTGQNVFRATLVRLANYESLYPNRNGDIVAVSRAQAYERLGAFGEAAANYEKALKSSDEALRKLARDGVARAKKFTGAVKTNLDASGLRPFERDLQVMIRDLDDLARTYRGSPFEGLALVEKERAQMRLAQFYVKMRFVSPYSTDDALTQIKRNIEQNSASKNRYTHHLMLGDFYLDLAREYAVLHDPDGTDFSTRDFEGFANTARSEFFLVQQADGFPEKLEGRARLTALEAFVERIKERAN